MIESQSLTTSQVADRLQCSPEHVRRLIYSKELRAFDIGRCGRKEWRIEQTWLDDFIKKKQQTPPEPVRVDPLLKSHKLVLKLD